MSITNNKRVTTAFTRITEAIHKLEFALMMNKTKQPYADGKKIRLDKHTKYTINRCLYDLRFTRTILSGTTFERKDPSRITMKEELQKEKKEKLYGMRKM
ncbi:MAG: hypothetical protein WCL18_10775 [bacterium]